MKLCTICETNKLQPLLIPNHDILRLLWMPGIGRIAAFTIYLEVDGIERFPTVKHFFSCSRVVPGGVDSGGNFGGS